MRRAILSAFIGFACFALAQLASVPASAQTPIYCYSGTGPISQSAPCSLSNPLAVSASVSFSGFAPASTGTPISVTTGGVTGTLPAGTVVVASNVGATNNAYCKLGASATTADQLISPNSWFAFTVGASTQLTCITSTSTTTVNMVGGSGLPTGAGGGGGGSGGGGAVTIADGADVTQGAVADAAATAGGTGTLSAKLRLMTTQLGTLNTSLGTINTTLGSPFQAGGSIGNTTFASTQGTSPWIVAGGGTAGSAATGVVTVQGIASMTPLLANPGTAANWGVGATAAAVPANAQYTGVNVGGNLVGLAPGTAGTASTQVFSVQGIAGAVNISVSAAGQVNHDAAAGNSPVLIGGYASAAAPTDVSADGDAVRLWSLRNGSLVVNLASGGTLVSPGTAANQTAIQAPVAAATATATKSVLLGGQFDTTQKTLTNGQQAALSVSARGAPFVAVGADGFSISNTTFGATVTSWGGGVLGAMANYGTSPGAVLAPGVNAFVTNATSPITPADGAANPTTAVPVLSYPAMWNGSTWDRLTGAAATGVKTSYSSQYPVGATPITASNTGTTGATTATLAGTSGKTTYICWYSIRANATANTNVTNTVTGTITGTLSSIMWVPANTAGLGVDEMIFNPCVPASATNTGIAIVSGAPGTGGLVSSKGGGYQL